MKATSKYHTIAIEIDILIPTDQLKFQFNDKIDMNFSEQSVDQTNAFHRILSVKIQFSHEFRTRFSPSCISSPAMKKKTIIFGSNFTNTAMATTQQTQIQLPIAYI